MAHIKFTDAVIRNLPLPEKGRVIYWAEGIPGFGVRCGATGKVFFAKVAFKGKGYQVTYGAYPETSLYQAQALHLKKMEDVGRGIAPREPVTESDKTTISDLYEGYFQHRTQNGYKDVSNQKNAFIKDVLPCMGKKSPKTITQKHIRECLQKTLTRIRADRPKDEGAGLSHIRHLQVILRGFFKWLVETEVIDVSPAAAMESVGVARVRERVLSPIEIFKFWHGIGMTGLDSQVVYALRFILATAQRGKEVRSLRWVDMDDDGQVWTISAVTAKNKKMHRVPLGCVARSIIDGARPEGYKRPDTDQYVFGATGELSDNALSRAILRNRELIGIGDVTPHDLRRTAATLIPIMGLPSFYASLLLNHSQQGVTNRVYVQYSYDAEKKKATDVLDIALSAIINAKNVDSVPTLDQLRGLVYSNTSNSPG